MIISNDMVMKMNFLLGFGPDYAWFKGNYSYRAFIIGYKQVQSKFIRIYIRRWVMCRILVASNDFFKFPLWININ